MKLSLAIPLCLAVLLRAESPRETLAWKELPALPNPEGFAGSYAGVSGGALFVAGGANFPDHPPWDGGTKVWYDSVFMLDRPDGSWRPAGRLPEAAGYGVSLSVGEGFLLIGGGDAERNFSTVRLAHWDKEGARLVFTSLPDLPMPLAMQAGAVLGRTVYVAGGLDRPDAIVAQNVFLTLDLDRPSAGWKTLPPWPGPERFLATAGSVDGSFFIFGGARLVPGPDGKPVREWLRDAFRYDSGHGWKQIADLPAPIVAAPSPAPTLDSSHLLLLGGDDGSQVTVPPLEHTGFPRAVRVYDAAADRWTEAGRLPFSLVTTPALSWRGLWIVPGGEAKPGIRSPAVWSGTAH